MPRYIGLMSGTSMDGIDAVLVELDGGHCRLEHTHTKPYSSSLRDRLVELARGERDRVQDLGVLDRRVGEAFARAAQELMERAGVCATEVRAIGSHGQTVRHYPSPDTTERYSLQIGDPATVAEITGVLTVADFRRQDIAAGGQGAPLVPAFHAAQFAAAGETRAIVNIGGISNATLLDGNEVTEGFDCGPGNTLLDAWIGEQRGESYDAGGAWAAEHAVLAPLLARLLDDAYFNLDGPRSTGPERFNLGWLREKLAGDEARGDVQATLAQLSATAIANSLVSREQRAHAVFVCGGGARNTDLMRRLHGELKGHGIRLGTTDELGLAAEWVEACAFAWLARQRLEGLPANVPVVTGASGPRVLGAIYERPRDSQ